MARNVGSGQMARLVQGSTTEAATIETIAKIRGLQAIGQSAIRAQSEVIEYAVSEVVYLAEIQRLAALGSPQSAGAVAALINIGVAGICRTAHELGAEL